MREAVLPDAEAPVVLLAAEEGDGVVLTIGRTSVEVSADAVSRSVLLSDLKATSEAVVLPIDGCAMQQWVLHSTRRSQGITDHVANVGDVKLLLKVLCSICPHTGQHLCTVSVRAVL